MLAMLAMLAMASFCAGHVDSALDVTLSDTRSDIVQWRIATTPPPHGNCGKNDEQRRRAVHSRSPCRRRDSVPSDRGLLLHTSVLGTQLTALG
jgi:hypothetical protein